MRPVILLLAAGTAWLCGCQSGTNQLTETAVAATVLDIQKGSPSEDLIALLGEPKQVTQIEHESGTIEVWSYELTRSQTSMVAYETQEIPFVNPLTGIQVMVSEPLYKAETTTVSDAIDVYLLEDHVIGWKVSREEDRNTGI